MNPIAATFKEKARLITRDLRHRQLIREALRKYEVVRDKRKAAFLDWQGARKVARAAKQDAITHLADHLEQFVRNLEARGTKVHWASNGARAREIILDIMRRRGAKSVVKSKAMTAEEIHLNAAIEKEGMEVVESDLGEFIVQLREEAPYHIVFPAMHLSRDEISETFQNKLGSAPTREPEELTMIARRVLRQKYVAADVGITGANFAVADTGMISVTENEGNARLGAALPRTMITLVGIEKVVPRLEDLAVLLPMLATAGAGQAISCYNTFYGGPAQPGEPDGPEEYHVVLLDNERSTLLADAEQREALQCIRCGACLNACPIFHNVGGHTYATTYPGPIGSVITPHLCGLDEWKHLSFASSLCGACTEACPVGINLHHHLLQNRRNGSSASPKWWEKAAFKIFGMVANSPTLWRLSMVMARLFQPLHPLVKGGPLDPAQAWTRTRELPPVARTTFKEWWRNRS